MIDLDDVFPLRSTQLCAALEAAPKRLLSASGKVNFRNSLPLDDPRYVHTTRARGELFERDLQLALGCDPISGSLDDPDPEELHLLVFGHVGCGKSTELKHLCVSLHQPACYWVVDVDLQALIDTNNVHYSDVWLAVAQELIQRLRDSDIAIDSAVIDRFHGWFQERAFQDEHVREIGAGIGSEAEVGGAIPLLGKLLARFTSSIRAGSVHRESIRTVVTKTYAQFSRALDGLIQSATLALRARGLGQQLLFVIDGADRCRAEDWSRLFVREANQLTQIKCRAVYTAPMALMISGDRLEVFEHIVLPMVKLFEPDGVTRRPAAFDALRELVLKRCHHSLFASTTDLDRLIEWSGGHIRDLLRLLRFACMAAFGSLIDARAVSAAMQRLGADYRNRITEEQYLALVKIDLKRTNVGTHQLLSELVAAGALLEYNAGSWRQSHPVIRTLAGYDHALKQVALRSETIETA